MQHVWEMTTKTSSEYQATTEKEGNDKDSYQYFFSPRPALTTPVSAAHGANPDQGYESRNCYW